MGSGMDEDKLSGTVYLFYSYKQSTTVGLTLEMQSNAGASILLENQTGLKDACGLVKHTSWCVYEASSRDD